MTSVSGGTELVRRVEPVDSLTVSDGVLVLYDHEVLRLGPLAAVVFDYCRQPRDVAQISAHLRQQFGEPPEGTAVGVAERAVATLRQAGVLR